MEAPFRYDLDAISCVNNEVKTFNRKHRKHLKIYSNASVIRIDSNREFYTKYGLHMNQKGKEQTAKMIGLEIKLRLKEKGGTPIILTDKVQSVTDDGGQWRNGEKYTNQGHQDTQGKKKDESKEEANIGNNSSGGANCKTPKRPRRQPVTRHKDFLWETNSKSHQC